MNQRLSDTSAVQQQIEDRINPAAAGALTVGSQAGGVAISSMAEVMEFSKLMAVAGIAVRKHLRNKPGTCAAVIMQAIHWRMDPFMVANKSYEVNDQIAYEAQLIQAVIEQRAPIEGRIRGRYEGEGDKRRLILTVRVKGEDEPIDFEGQELGKISPKNSPLWKTDSDQQQWYYTSRAMARRHFPDVLLGVYSKDEIEDSDMRDVTPEAERGGGFASLAQRARAAGPAPASAAPAANATDAEASGPVVEPPQEEPAREATEPVAGEQAGLDLGEAPNQPDEAADSDEPPHATPETDWFALRNTIIEDMHGGGVDATLAFYADHLADMKKHSAIAHTDVQDEAKRLRAEESEASDA